MKEIIFYKNISFTDNNAFSIIDSCLKQTKLSFTKYKSLNDKDEFDCYLDVNLEDIEGLKECYKSAVSHGFLFCSFEEWYYDMKAAKDAGVKLKQFTIPRMVKYIRKNVSVCSLANEWSESLWKNYAGNGESGFCICYNSDILKQFFSEFYYGGVEYKGHTVWLNEIKDPLEILLMKDKKWEDENEFRFTGINKALQKNKNFTHVKKKKKNGQVWESFLISVPKDAIYGVFVSNKMKQNYKNCIKKICSRNEWKFCER